MFKFRNKNIVTDSYDYPMVWMPHHSLSMKWGYVYIHRLVYYEKHGNIPKDKHVHHIDGDKWNWEIENLMLVSPAEHVRIHAETKLIGRVCAFCWGKFKISSGANKECCSISCAAFIRGRRQEKINWPSTDELIKRAEEIGFSALGRELGVSDNAIRKRIKNH